MFRMVSILGLVGTVAALALYHRILRAKHAFRAKERRDVYRFSFLERCIHAAAIVSLLILAFTGFVGAMLPGGSLTGWLWLLHYMAAPVFAAAVCVIALIWAEDCRFERHDWRWAMHLGGYLWKKDDLPASRFNAGQKAFFWFVALVSILVIVTGVGRMFPVMGAAGQEILYEVHRYAALGLAMAVIAHFYLGVFANPGTLWGMVSGYVSTTWAKHHHPIWWQEIEAEETE